MIDILIVGTISGDYGGTSVSLRHLLKFLKEKKVKFYHLETGGIRSRNIIYAVIMFIKLIFNFVRYSKKSKIISLHLNHSAVPILGPFIYVITKVLKKEYTIRIFGGYGYKDKNRIKNKISYFTVRNAFMYFAQTKKLFKEAKFDNIEAEWFPTVRPDSMTKISSKSCKRLVYVGRIIEEKGVFTILNASTKISNDISIDFYGPFQGALSIEIFNDYDNVQYKGLIEPKNIYETLLKYDLMLFPTFYPGEGYPGIILEALNVGKRIISTNWLEIADIINEDCALFIEPDDDHQLFKAIKEIHQNNQLYLKLCQGAINQSRVFDLEILYYNLLKIHGVKIN